MREFALSLLALFASYVMYSRAVTIPAGVALHLPPELVFLLVFLLDLAQVPVLMHIYEKGTKIPFLNKLNLKDRADKNLSRSKAGRWAQKVGPMGVIALSCLPTFGGGMWSAVLLTHVMGLKKRRAYAYLAAGSFIGCFLLTYASKIGVDALVGMKDVVLHELAKWWPLG